MWKRFLLATPVAFLGVLVSCQENVKAKPKETLDERLYNILERGEQNAKSDFERVKMDYGMNSQGKGVFKDGPLLVTAKKQELIELDIALTYEQVEQNFPRGPDGRRRRAAISNERKLWPGGKVPYRIDYTFSSSDVNVIKAAMQSLESETCLKFVQRTNQRHYISFESGDIGCWSFIGMQGRRQVINLNRPGCVWEDVVAHELLHACGLYHTQSRYDRDDYVTILYRNIQDGMERNFLIQSDTVSHGLKYDLNSIMHYGPKAFSSNGRYTIVAKDLSFQSVIGTAEEISTLDSKLINTMYKCGQGKATVACLDSLWYCRIAGHLCGLAYIGNACPLTCNLC